ncbi:MAG: hypothetical protein JRN37_08615 [Nitrososphaerota archaeon]|jgi:predicted Fe-Mo cluster-binding NifX family protein|nr:hypothetical protein [Nitrososphaerota archaeon]
MKIAIVTNDGKIVHSHFGMAKNYIVFEVENGIKGASEMRPKIWHQHHPEGVRGHEGGNGMHYGEGGHSQQEDMLAAIRDCQVLVARGMGRPMYDGIISRGIRPYLTDLVYVEDVVNAYIDGKLDNHIEKLD